MNDPYKTLGVSKSATRAEIESAHKKLYVKNHPDKFKDPSKKAEAEKKCKQINEAYSILIDPEKKRMYDLEAAGAYHQSNGYSQDFVFDQSNGYSQDFIFNFDFKNPWSKKSEKSLNLDIQLDYTISVESAYYGTKSEVKYKRKVFCNTCNQGSVGVKFCPACRGSGYLNFIVTTVLCGKCNGTGKSGHNCSTCMGSGFLEHIHRCILVIPSKVHDKQTLTFNNQGHKSATSTGKLKIVLNLTNTSNVRFDEQGNLHIQKEVDLQHILSRKPLAIKLFNENLTLDLPFILDSKTILKMPGYGLKYKNVQKDLYIELRVRYPFKG